MAVLKSQTSKLQEHKEMKQPLMLIPDFQISNVFKFFKIFLREAQLVVMNSPRMELALQSHERSLTVDEITRQSYPLSLKFMKQIY